MKSRILLAGLALAVLLAACSKDSTGPDSRRVQVAALAGDAQFALADADVAEPLQVLVSDPVTDDPVKDITITWTVKSGPGTVSAATSKTDVRGIATTRLHLGALGAYVVEASASRMEGSAARFTAQAVLRPAIQSIAPGSAAAGQTITITGSNFSTQPDYNIVRFDGVRGRVTAATSTRLDVIVPNCVATRTVNVEVALGAVASATQPLAATGLGGSPLSLRVGEVRSFADPSDLGCVRLVGGISAARYLLVAQNAASTYSSAVGFVLATSTDATPVTLVQGAVSADASASLFELRLRQRERALGWAAAAAELRKSLPFAAQIAEPQVGDRRSFNVLTPDEKSVSVAAVIKAISGRAIIYQDVDAPSGGFTDADFTSFGRLFDDPIYDTDVAVFGPPTDIDANGKIIILFTPRVNALTKRGDASYVAGYFYGCDLVEKTRCSETNRGEIFYSFVPDPQAKYSDARQVSTVLRAVTPVLAHEFQHMINFGQRGSTLDVLWLSEALAHTAEDVVGDVFAGRGDPTTARDFQRGNYVRADRFLSKISDVSMIAEESPGTLELRGAGWLFLRYLRAQYGGNALLAKLTRTTLSSTTNVATQTGQSWSKLLSDFGVALYVSGAAEPAAGTIAPQYTFGTLPVRATLIAETGGYRLTPPNLTPGMALSDSLPSSASALAVLSAPANTTYGPINVVFSGALGGPFPGYGKPQLAIVRLR